MSGRNYSRCTYSERGRTRQENKKAIRQKQKQENKIKRNHNLAPGQKNVQEEKQLRQSE